MKHPPYFEGFEVAISSRVTAIGPNRYRVKATTRRVRSECCNKTVRSRCLDCPHNSYPALYRGFSK